jgi:hypothetical protein
MDGPFRRRPEGRYPIRICHFERQQAIHVAGIQQVADSLDNVVEFRHEHGRDDTLDVTRERSSATWAHSGWAVCRRRRRAALPGGKAG